LCFAMCVEGQRSVIRAAVAAAGSTQFEANWNARGEAFLKVNGKLVGRSAVGMMRHEPRESIQIGADLGEPVGDYVGPNYFSGSLEELTYKYPNGS